MRQTRRIPRCRMNGRTCRYLTVLFLSTLAIYMYLTNNVLSGSLRLTSGHVTGNVVNEQSSLDDVQEYRYRDRKSTPGPSSSDHSIKIGRYRIQKTLFGTQQTPIKMQQYVRDVYEKVYSGKPEVLSNQTIVLIIAYMRTGSTLTGSIFQEYHNTFYAFEPIRAIMELFKRSAKENQKEVTLKYFNRDRNVSLGTEFEIAHEEIKTLLTCNLRQLSIATMTEPFHQQFTKYMRTFRACVMRYRTGKSFGRHIDRYIRKSDSPTSVHACLEKVIDICKSAPAIIIKFIRLNMEETFKLLPYFPNLKIIHLVRDPRGIMNSRIKVGYGVRGGINRDDVQSTCKLMSVDFSFTKFLLQKEPTRVKIVQYEDLAESPVETAAEMLSFAGLHMTPKLENYLKHMTSSSRDSCDFCTLRKNSSETASKWRMNFNVPDAFYVYNSCKAVMDFLGYTNFLTMSDLQNMQIPSRRKLNVNEALLDNELF